MDYNSDTIESMALVYGLNRKSDPTIRYIGMTTKPMDERFGSHNRAARNGAKRPVYDWWRKHNDISYVILHDGLTTSEAFYFEKKEIAARENLLNLTEGGDGMTNPTAEVRAKLSKAHKGHRWSDETKARVNANRKPISDETKRKMSIARQGRKLSENARQKAKNSYANAPTLSCPHCGLEAKRNLAMRWHFDNCSLVKPRSQSKPMTEEHRKNLSIAASKRWARQREERDKK